MHILLRFWKITQRIKFKKKTFSISKNVFNTIKCINEKISKIVYENNSEFFLKKGNQPYNLK